jgi:ferritin-like metal-binding protein YciE
MSKLNSLQDLFLDEIKDLLNAEKQIIGALPKMAKKATNPQLKSAFEEHLEQTKNHVTRLEQVFASIGEPVAGKTCKAMKGIMEEGKDILEEEGEPSVLDAALIAAAQRVEHYEMAGYGCVRTYARILGYTEAEKLLQETLDEEAETDEKLSALAEKTINVQANQTETAGARG